MGCFCCPSHPSHAKEYCIFKKTEAKRRFLLRVTAFLCSDLRHAMFGHESANILPFECFYLPICSERHSCSFHFGFPAVLRLWSSWSCPDSSLLNQWVRFPVLWPQPPGLSQLCSIISLLGPHWNSRLFDTSFFSQPLDFILSSLPSPSSLDVAIHDFICCHWYPPCPYPPTVVSYYPGKI